MPIGYCASLFLWITEQHSAFEVVNMPLLKADLKNQNFNFAHNFDTSFYFNLLQVRESIFVGGCLHRKCRKVRHKIAK